jgi:Fe-S cluster assembly protein SufD
MSVLADFPNITFPTNKTEEYRFTPIAKVLEKAFPNGFKSEGTGITSIEEFLIPGLDSDVAVVLNGSFEKGLSKLNGEYTLERFKKPLPESPDPFAQLNTAFAQDGISIKVNSTVARPLLILNINNGSQSVHSTLSVSIENSSSFTIIQRSINTSSEPVFQTLVEDISVSQNARLDYCKIQNTPKIIEVCNTSIQQADNSHVNTFTLTMDGMLVRNNLSISIDGEHCESHFHGLSLLKGDTIGDHHTVVDHRKPNSFSNELYKGVMDEKSKGVFNGKIYVRPHAQKTNAFQSNRNILLTEQATINTKPQLEIWADDVKCSHGCTTGQLDDEALFYLQSRGISKTDARAMLLYAFAMQTTEFITLEPLKVYIDRLISTRLYA